MSIDTVETLHAQHDKGEKWNDDLLIHTVLKLLSGPFSDDKYRDWEPFEAKIEIETYLSILAGTKYEKRSKRVVRKVKKLETTKEIILYLGEVILSD